MRVTGGRNRLLVGTLAALLLAAGTAAAAGPRAPVLLYISGSTPADLPGPVGAVRARATAGLEQALAAAGVDVVPTGSLMPALTAGRVRSPLALGRGFLDDLAAGTGSSHLLVAVLLVDEQRLQLLTRLIHLESGCAVWAANDEEALARVDLLRADIDADAWYAGLDRLCAAGVRAAANAPADGARALILLPARGVGCGPDLALAATHSLLAPLAGDRRWRVIDPGLAAATLQDAGVPPARVDADGCRRLAADLGDVLLAAPEIVVYAPVAGRAAVADGEDGAPAAAAEEFELVLRFLDAGTGTVVATFTRHRDHGPRIGWFGVRSDVSMLAGLGTAAKSLWQQVDKQLEDR